MTYDMKFEALVVSQSVNVLNDLLEIMEELPIDVNVCMLPSRAVDLLAQRDFDLLIVDYGQSDGAGWLTRKSRASTHCRRLVIAALTNGATPCKDIGQTGADVLIQKPLTAYSRDDFRDLVYSRMVKEWHRESRYAINWLVAAKDPNERPVPLTMDIR